MDCRALDFIQLHFYCQPDKCLFIVFFFFFVSVVYCTWLCPSASNFGFLLLVILSIKEIFPACPTGIKRQNWWRGKILWKTYWGGGAGCEKSRSNGDLLKEPRENISTGNKKQKYFQFLVHFKQLYRHKSKKKTGCLMILF